MNIFDVSIVAAPVVGALGGYVSGTRLGHEGQRLGATVGFVSGIALYFVMAGVASLLSGCTSRWFPLATQPVRAVPGFVALLLIVASIPLAWWAGGMLTLVVARMLPA